MAIDIDSEDLIPFQQAAAHVPGPRKPCLQTLHRWRLRGARGRMLETVLIGGIRHTSVEAIRRFIVGDAVSTPQSAPRRKSHDVAAAKLNALFAKGAAQ
ncbi:MAG: DUF1580 domain-containing protein [Planctomycetaceae bacterium]|nr:DUF1580 domain-containing protein [Planctomycetaceae bacterium]